VERGCIVNLRHVVNIQENTLILSNKQTVDVSSRRVKHVKEGMSRYWRDE
jgi:DNA-binding LytR/AlgR family response regulator